jgi:hypothetical protein
MPPLVVPGVFATADPQTLVITYDGATLLLYVNGVLRSPALELTPGVVAFGGFFDRSIINMKLCKVLYYALIFIPLGILLSLGNKPRGRFAIQALIIGGGTLFPSLMLEGILVGVSGKSVSLENLLLSMMFTVGTIVVLSTARSNYAAS